MHLERFAVAALLLSVSACGNRARTPATTANSNAGGAGQSQGGTTGAGGRGAAGTAGGAGSSNASGGESAAASGGMTAASGGMGTGGRVANGGATTTTAGGSGGMLGAGNAGGAAAAGRSAGGHGGSAGESVAGGAGSVGTAGASGVVSGGVRWVGRVDVSDPTAPQFAWSGTGFVATVTGDAIAVKLRSDGATDPVFFQPVIDGTPGTRFSVASSEGEKTVSLGTGLGAGDHVVGLYRETEGKASFAYSTFLGFASGTPKDPPAYGGRLIELVGDSISAGYGDLGSEQHPNGNADPNGGCGFTTQTESAYVTYGAVAARALNADASIIAASGWGIYSDASGNTDNVLPNVFGDTVGGQADPAWSFAVKPQAVVINLGTNDFGANMSLGQSAFSTAYTGFLATVRAKYPDAFILCAIGPLLYGTGLTNATAYITALVADANQKGDQKIKVLNFGQQDATQGTGCDWHPSAAEHQHMADMLVAELKADLGW